MNLDRIRSSRIRSRARQARRAQKRLRQKERRDHLTFRLAAVCEFAQTVAVDHELPADWISRYPELSAVLPQLWQLPFSTARLFLLNEEVGRWFFVLRGRKAAQEGFVPRLGRVMDDWFTIDLMILADRLSFCLRAVYDAGEPIPKGADPEK